MSQIATKRKYERDEYDEICDRKFTSVKRRYIQKKKFMYDVPEVIFVCSPSAEIDPSFIATLLASYDPNVVLNHHWAPLSPSPARKVWYGTLATFSSETFARIAVHRIQRKHR